MENFFGGLGRRRQGRAAEEVDKESREVVWATLGSEAVVFADLDVHCERWQTDDSGTRASALSKGVVTF